MDLDGTTPYVVGDDIGEAYTRALDSRITNDFPHRYRTIHISNPVGSVDSIPSLLDFEAWRSTVNAGTALRPFQNYEFHDGTTGQVWVQNRIEELFDGMYASRLRDGTNQIELITQRLKKGNHGQTTNALVAQVFREEPDLQQATHGRPLAQDMACMTQLQFRPTKDRLNLYSVFRSQYFDTKCYGNLISLAILLARVCHRAGYEPGYLVETVHNSHFRNHSDAKGLHSQLISSQEGPWTDTPTTKS